MTLQAKSVYGVGSRGRELSIKLAHTLLEQMEEDPKAVILLATPEYDLLEASKAMRVILGDVPVWGGSVRQVWSAEGTPTNGMSLTAIGGDGVETAGWWIEEEPKPNGIAQTIQALSPDLLFVGLEAMQSRLRHWLAALENAQTPLIGGLVGSDLRLGRMSLLAGQQVGHGGAAILGMRGLKFGIGIGTPWRSTGLWVEITESRGEWLRKINGKPVAEVMEEIFGQPARRWAYAPLREFARLYPLGMQTETGWDIRAPIHVETDGSWRMTIPMPHEGRAYWMTADIADAILAVEKALEDAVSMLGSPPAVVFMWLDWAWSYLLTAHEPEFARRIRERVGEGVPVVGVYTLGQLSRAKAETPLSVLHNHVAVCALASGAN